MSHEARSVALRDVIELVAQLDNLEKLARDCDRRVQHWDDEIAKLEEQLRKLKEEKSPTVALEATEMASTSVTAVADQKIEEEIPISMFLSEGWKEGDNNNGNNGTIQNKQNNAEADKGGIIGNLLKALGVVVVLIALSQIPVGQENLSKYSGSIKSGENPASTSIDLGDVNRVKNADL